MDLLFALFVPIIILAVRIAFFIQVQIWKLEFWIIRGILKLIWMLLKVICRGIARLVRWAYRKVRMRKATGLSTACLETHIEAI